MIIHFLCCSYSRTYTNYVCICTYMLSYSLCYFLFFGQISYNIVCMCINSKLLPILLHVVWSKILYTCVLVCSVCIYIYSKLLPILYITCCLVKSCRLVAVILGMKTLQKFVQQIVAGNCPLIGPAVF